MAIERFEQLEVWQFAHAVVLAVYRLTSAFPDHERFGLTSQMRRAAVSVPANIAEAFKRRGPRDKIHFYNSPNVARTDGINRKEEWTEEGRR